MLIRNKLRIFGALFLGISVLALIGFLYLAHPVTESIRKLSAVIDYRNDLYTLTLLQQDYLNRPSPRAEAQWRILVKRLGSGLNQPHDWTLAEEEQLSKMRPIEAAMESIFLSSVLQASSTQLTEQRVNAIAQLESLDQRIIDLSFTLTGMTILDITDRVRISGPIFFALFIFLMMLGAVLFYSVLHTIAVPIQRLDGIVKRVPRFSTQLHIDADLLQRNDELGSLARTLADVTHTLSELYRNLEKKVTERTRDAEEAKKEAERHVEAAETLNRLTIGRELKMLELKKQIRALTGSKRT
ncbi:hypothetical protein KBC54_03030 [Patescibacteria group bacterium]|nr:hypothetical protein [Patescibacteria group bacterium]